jgi:hypothetical protein
LVIGIFDEKREGVCLIVTRGRAEATVPTVESVQLKTRKAFAFLKERVEL